MHGMIVEPQMKLKIMHNEFVNGDMGMALGF